MGSWNYYGGPQTLVRLQGRSLQHLHFGPHLVNDFRRRPPFGRMKLGSISLNSLHFEITTSDMSQAVAEIISTIPPKNIVFIGLDMPYGLIYGESNTRNLRCLAKVLENRGFGKLRGIHVRLEFASRGFRFEPTVQALRDVFPEKFLSVESLPRERRYLVRDVTDDCYQSLG